MRVVSVELRQQKTTPPLAWGRVEVSIIRGVGWLCKLRELTETTSCGTLQFKVLES